MAFTFEAIFLGSFLGKTACFENAHRPRCCILTIESDHVHHRPPSPPSQRRDIFHGALPHGILAGWVGRLAQLRRKVTGAMQAAFVKATGGDKIMAGT